MRDVSGSAESNGWTPRSRRNSQRVPSWRRLTVAIIWRWPGPSSFQRPMWWLHATTPGRIPSVTQAFTTKWPMRVSTRTRSPVRMPSESAWTGCIHSGVVCAISSSHFALALRVWICTGRRKATREDTVDLDAHRAATMGIGIGGRHRDHVRRARLRCLRVDAAAGAHGDGHQLRGRDDLFVERPHPPRGLEGSVAAHVLEGAQLLAAGLLGKTGHRVLEDPTVVLVDGELESRASLRLEVLPNAEAAVGVDPPAQLDPELVLLPDLAGVDVPRVRRGIASASARLFQDRLAEADPLRVVCLVGVEVVALGAQSYRQHVIGEVGRLAPCGGEGHVEPPSRLAGRL